MNIYEKLGTIQLSLNAPKDKYNGFGKYSYRSCEGILEALKPLLVETETTILLTDAVKEIGNRIYIEATATLIDVKEGTTVTATAYAREEDTKKGMDSSQVTGAASSYARKYALNGLFAIDDNKDSDATNDGSQQPVPKPRQAPKQPAAQNPAPPPPQQAPKQRKAPPPPDIAPEPLEAEDGYYYCQDCGQMISGVKLQNGHELSPKDVVLMSMKSFNGAQLCYHCGYARGHAGQ